MDEEEDELRALFQACDSNGNGTLQFSEFVTFLDNVGAGMAREECRIGFEEIDADRDGHIDFDEFLRWWEER
jgi:calmodulin